MGSRTVEFILGLIGGILGFFGALIALFLGGLAAALGESFGAQDAIESGTFVVTLGFGAIVFSVIGIIGSVLVKSKPKLGGGLMIVSAIGGLISISFFYLLSFVLLLIAGLMGIFKKDKEIVK